MANVIATIPGRRPDRLVLASHYDTKLFREFRFVGANDGASSTAALLELGRVLKARQNELTIELLFLDGEEARMPEWRGTDNTYGSRHYVQAAQKSGSLKSLKALVLLDMIGDRDLLIKRDSNSTPWLVDIIWAAAARLGHSATFSNQLTVIEDDHIPFLRAGVAAADIIDLENPTWHTPQDDLEHVSAKSLQVVGDVVVAAIPEIEKQHPPRTLIRSEPRAPDSRAPKPGSRIPDPGSRIPSPVRCILPAMSILTLKVNGRSHQVDVDPSTPLLYVLSDDLELRGPKFGCGLGQCGACTVMVNGQATRSCVTPVSSVGAERDHHARGSRHRREAPSAAAGVHRRTSGAVRILPERRHPDGEDVPRPQPARDRRTDPAGALRRAVPLLRQRAHAQSHSALRRREDGMRPHLSPDARQRARPRRLFAAIVPQRLGRPGRRVLVGRRRRRPERGIRAGLQRNRQHPARFLDRHRTRRHRHGLHRASATSARDSTPRRCSWWQKKCACP